MHDVAHGPDAHDDPHRQEKIQIVEGLLRALDDMDRINAVVRTATDGTTAVAALVAPPFGFSEEQAHYVLDMPVRRQTQQSRGELVAELARLRAG